MDYWRELARGKNLLETGLEPARALLAQWILSPVCLPFHHSSTINRTKNGIVSLSVFLFG